MEADARERARVAHEKAEQERRKADEERKRRDAEAKALIDALPKPSPGVIAKPDGAAAGQPSDRPSTRVGTPPAGLQAQPQWLPPPMDITPQTR